VSFWFVQTQIVNAMRAHLGEFGIVVPKGIHNVERLIAACDETVRNFVPWRILLRHWEAFFEHDGELAFDGVPFAD
jgi:hypothetical protein